MAIVVTYTHWLPIVTFCPKNNLPDFIYIRVKFKDAQFNDLYEVRRKIKKAVQWKRMYMEEVAAEIVNEFPDAIEIVVKLIFNKHYIAIRKT